MPLGTELYQCTLTAGMGGAAADVNAGVYDVKITRGDVLAGCILSAPTACPEKYSRTTRVNGVITECRPADGTQITCPENNPIPVRDTAGVVVDCQPISGKLDLLVDYRRLQLLSAPPCTSWALT